MPTMLWTAKELKDRGAHFNDELRDDFLAFSEDVPTIPKAVAYASLCIANQTSAVNIPYKRQALVDLVLGPRLVDGDVIRGAHLKLLELRRWAPVQKAIQVFSGIQPGEVAPSLDDFLKQQAARVRQTAPSWATLMPDKLYALAVFRGKVQNDALDPMFSPFGWTVEKAFAHYSGVEISGQPKMVHHEQLRRFQRSWAHGWLNESDTTVLDVNTGLHLFGEALG